jgi:fucose permease
MRATEKHRTTQNPSVSFARHSALLDGVAFAGMFVFGIVMALLGAVIPVLSERLALDLGDAGTLFLVTNGGILVASSVVGPLTDRLGMKVPFVLGAVLVALGLAGIARASGLGALLPAVACLGLGGGALNATTNTLVADLHEDAAAKGAALNLLGVFFGFGALILPFSIGALLSTVGIAGLLIAAAVLCTLPAVAALVLRFPAAKQSQGFPLAAIGEIARLPLVLVFAGLLFFQSANEFILGGYFATFLGRELGTPVQQASYMLAGYWASIMVSRLVLSRALLRVGAHRAVLGGAMLAAAGTILVALAQTTAIAMAGIVLTGLALAGIFPTVLGVAGAAFRERSGTAFGILLTVALIGGMTMPWIAGHLAEAAGLRSVFVFAAANFGAVALFNALASRRGRG